MDTYDALAIDNMPGMASPTHLADKAAAFKADIKLPVFHAARIADSPPRATPFAKD